MKLLITGAWKYSSQDIENLQVLGFECFFHNNENDPLPKEFYDADGIICNNLFLFNDVAHFKQLQFVQLTSAGLDRAPLDYFKSNGVKVFNAAGVYSIPISEFVISSVLDLYKKKFAFYENQKKHIWEKQRDLLELNSKTVCIIGCGNIGKECAKRFKAFGCIVQGVDLQPFKHEFFDDIFSIDNISSVLSNVDIVVLTLPLTDKTRDLFNRTLFNSMKQTAILVNVSRGGIINIVDLISALNDKTISGATLDVFDEEPLNIDSPLWNMSNVIITPHNSFVGDGNNKRLSEVILQNLETIK